MVVGEDSTASYSPLSYESAVGGFPGPEGTWAKEFKEPLRGLPRAAGLVEKRRNL